MSGLGITGKMIDLEDGTFIVFELPETLEGSVTPEAEAVVNARRNGRIRWWVVSEEKVTLNLTFVRQVDTFIDVKYPVEWIRSRAAPLLLGPYVTKPPPSFLLLMPTVDPAAVWEFDGPIEYTGTGNSGVDPLFPYPPRVDVSFTLARSDEGLNRLKMLL